MLRAGERPISAPLPNVETQPYWDAAHEGRLMIKRCLSCEEPHHYPRQYCPHCLGETVWEKASGEGVIYSYSIMRRVPVPFAIAYIQLKEGPIIISNVVECDLDALEIGAPVNAVFIATEEGRRIPAFKPLS